MLDIPNLVNPQIYDEGYLDPTYENVEEIEKNEKHDQPHIETIGDGQNQ